MIGDALCAEVAALRGAIQGVPCDVLVFDAHPV